MNKPKLILIGSGGHARSCIDVIEQHGQYQIAGLIGKPEELNTNNLGYSVIATDDDLPLLVKEYQHAFITIGQILSPDVRIQLFQNTLDTGFQLPTIISPSAYVSRHAIIGSGSIIMHGAFVNAGARVGENCIINTRALIEHDATVKDHCHISTTVVLNGNVTIGEGSFIGSGCVIKEGVTIGKECIVGMGLSVRHNQTDRVRFIGYDNQ